MSKQCTYGLKACTLNVHWYIYNIHIHTLYYIILLLYCVYIRNVYVSHNSLCRKYKGRQMHGWRWMKMMRMDSLKVSNDCMGPALKCPCLKRKSNNHKTQTTLPERTTLETQDHFDWIMQIMPSWTQTYAGKSCRYTLISICTNRSKKYSNTVHPNHLVVWLLGFYQTKYLDVLKSLAGASSRIGFNSTSIWSPRSDVVTVMFGSSWLNVTHQMQLQTSTWEIIWCKIMNHLWSSNILCTSQHCLASFKEIPSRTLPLVTTFDPLIRQAVTP